MLDSTYSYSNYWFQQLCIYEQQSMKFYMSILVYIICQLYFKYEFHRRYNGIRSLNQDFLLS